jgi:hypothetical protein
MIKTTHLKWFDNYVKTGLKPIAIYKGTKRPVGKGWNLNWSIERWRKFFENNNDYNMGILLGDVVDVEGDTKEANELLVKLIGGQPHPMFSSSKSIHHLFWNPDPDLTCRKFNGIEFRAHSVQSVVPPSIHEEGAKYQWLNSGFILTDMPEALRDYYLENTKESPHSKQSPRSKTKKGYTKTECKICKSFFYIHRKRLVLEVQALREYKLPWMCHGCREIDVRDSCRVIRKNQDQLRKNLLLPYVPLRDD